MGKSIRSKRMKALRSIKREKLAPRETVLVRGKAHKGGVEYAECMPQVAQVDSRSLVSPLRCPAL